MDTFRNAMQQLSNTNRRLVPRIELGQREIEQIPSPVLTVKEIYCESTLNGFGNNTYKYEHTFKEIPVVRRSSFFESRIVFKRDYNSETDIVSLSLYLEGKERQKVGTESYIFLPLLPEKCYVKHHWETYVNRENRRDILVRISVPDDAPVGKWRMIVETKLKSGGVLSYRNPQPVYILFNPWSKADLVYTPSDDDRKEYIEGHYGYIYMQNKAARLWKYDQFELHVLECAFYLLTHVANLGGWKLSDPVSVVKGLAMAVSNQGVGCLMKAYWGGNLNDGINPEMWRGSSIILNKYLEKKQPLAYGHTWVYAGLFTTLCRAIGILCRPVTNYNSAYNKNGNLTVEFDIDEHNIEMTDEPYWTYRVWNEVWLRRPDVGEIYSGWQAVDVTPPENGQHFVGVGPAPVLAVKWENKRKPYDTHYIYSKMHSDMIWWKNDNNGHRKLLHSESNFFGSTILTKRALLDEPEDITNTYKTTLSPPEDRINLLKSLYETENPSVRFGRGPRTNVIDMDFKMKNICIVGQDFILVTTIDNKSAESEHRVEGSLRIDLVSITGTVIKHIKKHMFNMFVMPAKNENFELAIPFKDYGTYNVCQYQFRVSCLARALTVDYEYYRSKRFDLQNPEVNISISCIPTYHIPFSVVLRIENTLPIPIKSGEFFIEGFASAREGSFKVKEPIRPGGFGIATIILTPASTGKQTLVAKFTSKFLCGVHGHCLINIH